jgi:hypothetical protein
MRVGLHDFMHSGGSTAIKAAVGPTSGPTWRLSHLVHPGGAELEAAGGGLAPRHVAPGREPGVVAGPPEVAEEQALRRGGGLEKRALSATRGFKRSGRH